MCDFQPQRLQEWKSIVGIEVFELEQTFAAEDV